NGNGLAITGSQTRREVTIWQEQVTSIGPWDARGQGFGGWSLSVHHTYDPVGHVLYLGTGERRDAQQLPPVISTVAGGTQAYDVDCYLHPAQCNDGAPATRRPLASVQQIALDAQGNLYIAEAYNCRIRMVDRGGTITTVAGVNALNYFGLQVGQCGSDTP